jgi:PAS domain S-box-containing protein
MFGWRRRNFLPFIGSHLLLCVLSIQIAFALAIIAALQTGNQGIPHSPVVATILGSMAAGLILTAIWAGTRGIRRQRSQRDQTRAVSDLMETVLDTSHEWLWTVDDQGCFTFSSSASARLLGYEPSELVGKPISTVIDPGELAGARQSAAPILKEPGSSWSGVTVACRHRNGAPVWMEVSGKSRPDRDGTGIHFEGTSRLLPTPTVRTLLTQRITERIDSTVHGGTILTAFQPIHELTTGKITGVEALARFPSDDGRSPDHWFSEAFSVGLGGELEFAALEAALLKSVKLPPHLYVALNLSPETCIDPLLPEFLEQSGLAIDRMVLELTERLAVDEYAPLLASLEPLRRRGLRIAVDDAGSGFSSMRHILHLRPDIIKLDRSLIAGIDSDQGQRALGAAMVGFATQIDAGIVAEGIETQAELNAVVELGMTSGQGYFLGRPTIHPADWATWNETGQRDQGQVMSAPRGLSSTLLASETQAPASARADKNRPS